MHPPRSHFDVSNPNWPKICWHDLWKSHRSLKFVKDVINSREVSDFNWPEEACAWVSSLCPCAHSPLEAQNFPPLSQTECPNLCQCACWGWDSTELHVAFRHCHTCIQVKNAIWVASFLSPTVRCRTLKPTSMISQPSASQILCDLKEGRKIVIVFYTLPILLNFLYPIYIPVPILPYLSTLCDSKKRGILKDISSYTTRRRNAQD